MVREQVRWLESGWKESLHATKIFGLMREKGVKNEEDGEKRWGVVVRERKQQRGRHWWQKVVEMEVVIAREWEREIEEGGELAIEISIMCVREREREIYNISHTFLHGDTFLRYKRIYQI